MQSKLITELTDLENAFHIRKEVFVKEQGVPLADEFDIFDEIGEQCKHILVYYHEFPVGTGRIRFVDGVGKLERICILKDYRTYGLGKVIIQTLEEIARNEQVTKVKLHGQTQAEGFYKKLGYQTSSDIFMEDSIPHILMTKMLS
ncbi:GNAT family N-acetyltransferase [Bacillus thuringiensis]|uniref:GNAT family N-acetyltransferase n=1 Tax=Bacillus thuringiensis TaxID=1428 RepID=UPI000BEBEBAC|nr:GNAT family N-acetyltransferase [Bacillus thuringiensis]PDZ00483.1 GNAT family N-acetyltransferase [Bacillus thuringiensis]PGV57974.1 GNAT family N-acetyltransferase [Bacillus thuringiensis]